MPLIERLLGVEAVPSIGVGRDVAGGILTSSRIANTVDRYGNYTGDVTGTIAEELDAALPQSEDAEREAWLACAALRDEVRNANIPSDAADLDGRDLPVLRVVQLRQSFRAVPALTTLWSEVSYEGAVRPVKYVGGVFGSTGRDEHHQHTLVTASAGD